MPKDVHVPLGWKRIEWQPGFTWMKDTRPSLIDVGIDPNKLDRCVYVIRLNGDYAIDYPGGETPTLYIGEGNFSSRINKHRKWVSGLQDLVGKFSFQICIATPRVRNNGYAYQDCEAALLDRFKRKFKSAPLWNKQFEKRRNEHYIYNERQMDEVLCKRSGAKYKWALRPLRSSEFYNDYNRTHCK